MIFKSYLVENDYSLIKNFSSILFYGENFGLKKNFKNKIKQNNKNSRIISFTQDEILAKEYVLSRELDNSSLFGENKIILIDRCTDKILKTLEIFVENGFNFQTIIFSDLLDKNSKLRKYYEKSKTLGSIACYPDNLITIQKIIQSKLRDFKGLTARNINMIVEACNLDRVTIDNEVEKIISFFTEKTIDSEKLAILLNNTSNENFNELKDEAIKGDKNKTNNLLNSTIMETDKTAYYLSLINQRFIRLKEVTKNNLNNNIEETIDKLRPPVFWKDKQNFLIQGRKWGLKKINKALEETYSLEKKIKSDSTLDKNLMIKKLIVDLCNLANS